MDVLYLRHNMLMYLSDNCSSGMVPVYAERDHKIDRASLTGFCYAIQYFISVNHLSNMLAQ